MKCRLFTLIAVVAIVAATGSLTSVHHAIAGGGGGALQISAGDAHTCAVLSGGTVWCWGGDYDSQLGGGATASSWTPVRVAGVSSASQVSAGDAHTCALIAGGTVECWGLNFDGQLGDGLISHGHLNPEKEDVSLAPVQVSGITSALQVSAGSSHTRALISGGTVECWGLGSALGDGVSNHGHKDADGADFSPIPVRVSGITDAVAIDAGGWHTCALLSTGQVRCWGDGTSGQLGDGASVKFYERRR
ncbi:MAG: hypothetical protein ABSC51_11770 [Gaiellaceae bacterium]|jgi:alpha-tubulin suppressor-like RCC1 family protein